MNPAGGDNEEEEFLDMDMGDIGLPGLSSSSPGFPHLSYYTYCTITSENNGIAHYGLSPFDKFVILTFRVN